MVQNFWHFFISTFFWLAFIPFYERLAPIFEVVEKNENPKPETYNNSYTQTPSLYEKMSSLLNEIDEIEENDFEAYDKVAQAPSLYEKVFSLLNEIDENEENEFEVDNKITQTQYEKDKYESNDNDNYNDNDNHNHNKNHNHNHNDSDNDNENSNNNNKNNNENKNDNDSDNDNDNGNKNTSVPLIIPYERVSSILNSVEENKGTDFEINNKNNNNNNDNTQSYHENAEFETKNNNNNTYTEPSYIMNYEQLHSMSDTVEENGNIDYETHNYTNNKQDPSFNIQTPPDTTDPSSGGQTRYKRSNFDKKGQVGYKPLDYSAKPTLFADVPFFNVTVIYYGTFSPTGIAIQMLQNFLNLFSTSIFWISYTPFYERMFPLFAPENQRSGDSIFNPVPYFKYLFCNEKDNQQMRRKLAKKEAKRKSPFLLIEDIKTFLYGEEFLYSEGGSTLRQCERIFFTHF